MKLILDIESSEHVILNSLIRNSILSPIKVLLHDWWTAYVGLFNLSTFFESLEFLFVGSLVHSLSLWLSKLGILLYFTDSRVVSEKILVAVFFAEVNEQIKEFKTHGLLLTSERSVQVELEVIQINWIWGSMDLLVWILVVERRLVHAAISLRHTLGSLTIVKTTVGFEGSISRLVVWVVHALAGGFTWGALVSRVPERSVDFSASVLVKNSNGEISDKVKENEDTGTS